MSKEPSAPTAPDATVVHVPLALRPCTATGAPWRTGRSVPATSNELSVVIVMEGVTRTCTDGAAAVAVESRYSVVTVGFAVRLIGAEDDATEPRACHDPPVGRC